MAFLSFSQRKKLSELLSSFGEKEEGERRLNRPVCGFRWLTPVSSVTNTVSANCGGESTVSFSLTFANFCCSWTANGLLTRPTNSSSSFSSHPRRSILINDSAVAAAAAAVTNATGSKMVGEHADGISSLSLSVCVLSESMNFD